MLLGDIHRRNAQLYGDKPAFVMDGQTVTFAEYNRRSNRLVHALLGRGVRKGDRLAILANNCLEYMDVYGAGEKGGFPVAPFNFRLTGREVAQLCATVRPRVLFVQDRYRQTVDGIRSELASVDLFVLLDGALDDRPSGPAGSQPGAPAGGEPRGGWVSLATLVAGASDAEPAVDLALAPEDICYLLFTSGTTGLPRAAMLTHQGQWLDATVFIMEMALTHNDRHLNVMPLYHIGGRAMTLAHTLRGCTVVMHDSFDAGRTLADIEVHRITTLQAVPTMIAWLTNHPDVRDRDLSSLRLLWYAAAPMPAELLRRALETFGPVLMQSYGQTETGPNVTTLYPADHHLSGPGTRLLTSCGRPVPGVQVRIVGPDGQDLPYGEVGEIAVRSPYLMVGYWDNPAATAQVLRDGWLYTGDMGRMEAAGYLYVVDRQKDMIISGGENIFPREVEEVLYAHSAVAEAAVIGVPDPVWGESVKALVVLAPGAAVTEAELIAFCRQRLAGYKRPKSVEFRAALAKSPSGKILKRSLREPYWQDRQRRV